jgi:hypothetical protein
MTIIFLRRTESSDGSFHFAMKTTRVKAVDKSLPMILVMAGG